ncbi:MAG: urate hydroxylase PuuD [Acidobacteria bacterium]|nr:urate hydroxylase PuuD [Acidobacteriota bacterium]
MTSFVREWLNLGFRWFHIFAGILWVGQTYYFTWLDHQFANLERAATGGVLGSSVWMVHSGGFYAVSKKQCLEVRPQLVRWFRWEALLTWLSGIVLLFLVYYFTGGLVDSDVADISRAMAIIIGLSFLGGGWLIYDLAARWLVDRPASIFALFAFIMTAAFSWALLHLLSGRAAYIHVGAIFGTIMTANVWLRILPAQRKMMAAAAAGTRFDRSLGAQAKLRSKHNTFMAVPVVFFMISNHFPVVTYGSTHNWAIQVFLVVLGWAAARLIRSA